MANFDQGGLRALMDLVRERAPRSGEVDPEPLPPRPSASEYPPYVPFKPIRNEAAKVGRNDPCPCGSGKKYKKCCGAPK